jgi:phosphate transport system substrate-binding protein
MKAGTVDFGSSDAPLKPEDLAASNLVQFPLVMGGIVPVVNLAGVAPGKIRFTGPLLADIYLGKITTWNDPAIAAVNPGMALPAQRITVVHRSDGSGTTFNWVNYLSKVSPEWKTKVGEGTSVRWPTGVGGKGNEGVAAYTKQIKGAIGYVELSYALVNKMSYGAVQNAAGNYVLPSAETVQAAAASAEWTQAKDFFLVITNAPGDNSWPITATNFALLSKKPKNVENNRHAREFFAWAYANGGSQASDLGYVPLPAPLVEQIEAYWASTLKK